MNFLDNLLEFFIDVFLSIIVPLAIPIISTLLSDIKKPSDLEVTKENEHVVTKEIELYKKIVYISPFWLEMPGSYIANALWNLSYHIKKLEAKTVQNWSIVFGILLLFQIIQIIHSKRRTDEFAFVTHTKIMGVILIVLSLFRICYNYFLNGV